ncbi:ABC transporter ATP-binding protein [Ruania alba]|uniref:Putative ABC transport system ATP-binding protein n=1 Tax=Ruania alba TaxID=648782 RepID=A0A1H5KBM9_9MICO|nr:ABC transporter ATP-binding protein [Ruania alba]SEE62223.1 putative ABC transport system ATP-binding protein [Ruania alba]
MLELHEVSKTFFAGTVNERRALVDLSLHLKPGEFVTIIGSNGAGKSTLLNTVAGALIPDSGTVRLDGQDVTRWPDHRRARLVGRVFQDPMAGTAPAMTIEQNLAIALARGTRRGLRRGVTAAKRERFRAELASLELGLEDRLSAAVGLLSGGQRQALSLLMATFSEPRVLLLDEHTAALDPSRAALVTELTEKAVARHHLTTVMVTHNMEQALRLGTRLIMMHEGRVVVDLDGDRKQKATVADLLSAFEHVKGADLGDRTLLQ